MNQHAEMLKDLFDFRDRQYLSCSMIRTATGLTQAEVSAALAELMPMLEVLRTRRKPYYRMAIKSETKAALARWYKPFSEMTKDSYKKHLSKGVVSL